MRHRGARHLGAGPSLVRTEYSSEGRGIRRGRPVRVGRFRMSGLVPSPDAWLMRHGQAWRS